jgi:hypothetical protein
MLADSLSAMRDLTSNRYSFALAMGLNAILMVT